MRVTEAKMPILTGGQSQKVAFTNAASTQSTAIAASSAQVAGGPVGVMLTPDGNVFVRYDTNPTASSDGTDQILIANVPYRIEVMPGGKFAFWGIAATGNVYITPGV